MENLGSNVCQNNSKTKLLKEIKKKDGATTHPKLRAKEKREAIKLTGGGDPREMAFSHRN